MGEQETHRTPNIHSVTSSAKSAKMQYIYGHYNVHIRTWDKKKKKSSETAVLHRVAECAGKEISSMLKNQEHLFMLCKRKKIFSIIKRIIIIIIIIIKRYSLTSAVQTEKTTTH